MDEIAAETWTDEADADLQALDYSLARSGEVENARFPCEDSANERLTRPAIVFREWAAARFDSRPALKSIDLRWE